MRVRTTRLVTVSGILAALAGLWTAFLAPMLAAPYGAAVVSYLFGFVVTACCGYVAVRSASRRPVPGVVAGGALLAGAALVATPFVFAIPSYPVALSTLLTGVLAAVPVALSALDRSDVGVDFDLDLDVLPSERPSP